MTLKMDIFAWFVITFAIAYFAWNVVDAIQRGWLV